jgi:hypothetical protein
MWAMSLGGLVAGWIGLALVVSASNVDDETLAGLLGLALGFFLASFYLVLRTAHDLARYKGRSPGVWVAVTLFFGLLAVGLLAVLDNLRLTQTGTAAGATTVVVKNGFVSELEQLAALHAAGTISDSEFVQAKQRLLVG